MRTVFILVLCFFCLSNIKAQQFGGNPPSTRWYQMDSDTARIIFPQKMDSMAAKVANLVTHLARHNPLNLGNQLKKVDIVLQPQTINANGYVSLGPFRSEFYTTPPADNFDLGSLEWLTQLTLHEYRHVHQYNNFNHGLSTAMRYLFGQEGYALAINTAIPNWFFEGDAVYQETSLSPQGRGRMPSFLKGFPALWQSGKEYGWMKLRNGSYKDFTPSHYVLGYLLVNYGIQEYGPQFWKNVTHDASAFKGLFYPMQKAIKKYSGLKYKEFTHKALNYYKHQYQTSAFKNNSFIKDEMELSPLSQTVTHYQYPFQIAKDSLLYLKTGNNIRPAFYIKDKHKEHRLRWRDISIDNQYCYRNGKIVYAALESDPRWRWRDYSVIKILDIHSGKQRTLQHKTRYFSPDISADGTLIAANHVKEDGSSALVILNATDGSILKEISQKDIAYFTNPKIINNRTVIAVLRYTNSRTSIASIDINSGSIELLIPPSFTLIGQIDAKEDKVYFSAAQHLKDEIFYYDISSKQLYKLPTNGVGSYFINADYDKITWSSFTASGYQLKQVDISKAVWEPVSWSTFTNVHNGFSADTSHPSFLHNIPTTIHSVKPYRKLTKPFNFHSWRPDYEQPEFRFTLYGNNILNTTQTQLYYLYNENNRTHTAGGSFIYGGLFPYIRLGTQYTFDRRSIINQKLKEWNEWNSYVGLSLPLTWTSGRTYKTLTLYSDYHYRADFHRGSTQNDFRNLRFNYLRHGISWSQRVPTTVQDIFPRWGYRIASQYTHALNIYKSWQSYTGISLYLPGIAPAQHLVLNGGVQYSGNSTRIFSNNLPFARGYTTVDSAGAYTASANYHLTLLYPDWGFANILYLSRIRANIFFDHTRPFDKYGVNGHSMQSAGTEIYFDTKWWNQHPITLGFRIGRHLTPAPANSRNFFFEFLLPSLL